jgi:hypothetical protein
MALPRVATIRHIDTTIYFDHRLLSSVILSELGVVFEQQIFGASRGRIVVDTQRSFEDDRGSHCRSWTVAVPVVSEVRSTQVRRG